MGKALSIVGILFAIFSLICSILIMLDVFQQNVLPGLGALGIAFATPAVICGAIGIKKDDIPGLAIAALIIGVGVVILNIITIFFGIIIWSIP